jgi:hypothetical protein
MRTQWLSKVKLAYAITSNDATIESMDLRAQLDRLIAFIRKANLDEATTGADVAAKAAKP